jgi:hypothetical protein
LRGGREIRPETTGLSILALGDEGSGNNDGFLTGNHKFPNSTNPISDPPQ